MPKFQVDIPHSLSQAEAKQRIGANTGKLEKDYGATCVWQGDDVLTVSRKGLEARVAIEPARVHVDLNLGFLLTPLAGAITSGITKELSGILGGDSPAQP
jgi:putative polyhydroxyalkanoate system protein